MVCLRYYGARRQYKVAEKYLTVPGVHCSQSEVEERHFQLVLL
jgi:hypothetical protein